MSKSLNLRVGDLVEVLSLEEILATLDEGGRLEKMAFMPEMVRFCGQRFRVGKSAHKTCDTISRGGPMRSVVGCVHLEGLRCTGEAHGGCEAECMLFWKEAWLKRVDARAAAPSRPARPAKSGVCSAQTLVDATRVAGTAGDPEGATFSCQATELLKASTPITRWSPGQYVKDVRSGNVSLGAAIKGLAIEAFNRIQIRRNGRRIPHVTGWLEKTPKELLDLAAGDKIRVKSKQEIMKTLDVKEKNRGLAFDEEMTVFCGREFTVRKRVGQIINEKTGKMMKIKGDCMILNNVVCEAHYHRFCPRAIFPWWREIWLERVGDNPGSRRSG